MATLEPFEIGLIKGLSIHCNLSIPQIQAYFSFPERPVPEKLIRAIVEKRAATSETDFRTASAASCWLFRRTWQNRLPWHRFAMMRSAKMSLGIPTDEYAFGYRYHPVGQGGFCSGWFTRRDHSRFHFVYDCGTEFGLKPKRRSHVQREIDALASSIAGSSSKPLTLDLVTLSHFDEDHLSGLTDLISVFRVERLLLPHLSPWRRLCVALEKRAKVGSDLFAFIEAPAAFLLERFPDQIGEILLVGPGGDVAGPPGEPEVPIAPSAPRGGAGKMAIEDSQPGASGDADDHLNDPRVNILRGGAAITIDHLWEFLPYNDERMAADVTDAFKTAARPLVEKVRDHSLAERTREYALRQLQQLYDTTFRSRKGDPNRARRRNEISLFLYSGPIGKVRLLDFGEQIVRHDLPPISCWSPTSNRIFDDRFAQMFTGDGYLLDDDEWNAFVAYYMPHDRLRRAGLFQVPHHGSHKNWLPGHAQLLSPVASIFCSNPTGVHRHPRRDVLADFTPWNPRQVDGVHGWEVTGWYSLSN